MKVFRTEKGIVVNFEGQWHSIEASWSQIMNNDDAYAFVKRLLALSPPDHDYQSWVENFLLPPALRQEIWAAGVTYIRSKKARMEESRDAGGGNFYDRVYEAHRPELFFKCPWYRAVGHKEKVRIRKDSQWNVPEPELTLVITSNERIIGYTIGNDMSSRDIEGENPLYLPQAKTYDGSAAIGPCVLLTQEPLPLTTGIKLEILRSGKSIFSGMTSIAKMKRNPQELVSYLFSELSFKNGVLLMTGTGIIPPDDFSLQSDDVIQITIDPVGKLSNTVS